MVRQIESAIILHSLLIMQSCRNIKNLLFQPFNLKSIKIQILSSYVKPYLSLLCPWFETSLSMILNSLHVCSFTITKILQKSQFENFTFSQMRFREITRLNSTGPFENKPRD